MQTRDAKSNWHQITTLEQMDTKDRVVAKIAGKQIALFKTKAGIFAINNHCPHEGYPLVEGSLQGDCILACNWHGWSFDLKSGQAVQGRDAVKTFPIKSEGGKLFVKITPEDPAILQSTSVAEFQEAMVEHDYERIARSLCRFDMAGGNYEALVSQTILQSSDSLERGFGHAHAGLVDWINLAGSDPDLRLVAFLEALGHFSWDAKFSPAAPMTSKQMPWSESEFYNAVEAMDQVRAIQICNGAFAAGKGFFDLKPVFLRQIFSHYSGFGHPAIYVMKAEQLLEQLGAEIEQTICQQLARYLCVAAREDLIPEFRLFGAIIAQSHLQQVGTDLPDIETLSTTPLRKILPLVDGTNATEVETWEHLLGAAALHILKFDLEKQHTIEQPIAQNIGWLGFTHAITFAEALYFHAQKDKSLWRSGHMQQACFIGRNIRFMGTDQTSVFKVANIKTFMASQKAALFNMDAGEYIYSVHRLKMVAAVESLLEIVSDATADLLIAALNRFLSSPMRHKHPARTAYQARASVQRE